MRYILLLAISVLSGCGDDVANGKAVNGGSLSGVVRFSEMPNGDRCYTYRDGISCLPPIK
jgi:hypothetical protein